LLANLEKRSICRELNCFLEVEDDMLEGDDFADKATRDVFALLWKIIALLVEKAFFCLPGTMVFVVTFLVVMINGHC